MTKPSGPYEYPSSRPEDPEPISIGIALYAASVSTASLLLGLWKHRRDVQEERGRVRHRIFAVDKELQRLIAAWQELAYIYIDQKLLTLSTIGTRYIAEDVDIVEQTNMLRDTIFESWTNLEKEIDKLSEQVSEDSQELLQEYSASFSEAFDGLRHFTDVNNLMQQLGHMLMRMSGFVAALGDEHGYRSPYKFRIDAIVQMILQLREAHAKETEQDYQEQDVRTYPYEEEEEEEDEPRPYPGY